MTHQTFIPPNLKELAKYIDHTLLKPESTRGDVAVLIREAIVLGTYSVCVSPAMLPMDVSANSGLKIAVVCGFPSGKHASEVKAAEAALAISQGADEVDMVLDIGALKEGRTDDVEADIAAVRQAVPAPALLKVIIESAALTDVEIIQACRASVSAGADFVKTSTGFHPSGGASEHAVRLMAETVNGKAGVKASGGIRTREDALRMIAAGATRLGVSSSSQVLQENRSSPVAGATETDGEY